MTGSNRPKGTFPPPPRRVGLRSGANTIWMSNPFRLPEIIFTIIVLRLGLGASTRNIANYLFGIDEESAGIKSMEQWMGWVTRAAVKEMRYFNHSQLINCDLIIKALWAESLSPRDLTKTKNSNQVRWWMGILEESGFPLSHLAGYVQLPYSEEDIQDVLGLVLRRIERKNKQRQQKSGIQRICPRCTLSVNGQVRKGWMEKIREGGSWYAACINCGYQQFPPPKQPTATVGIST